MKTKTRLALFFMVLLLAGQPALAVANAQGGNDKELGERLLRQLWADMKKPDMGAIGRTIAPGFQSVHQNGASDREEEVELIRGLKLGNYTLSDIKISRNGPTLVITYLVSVEETIGGERLKKNPAARLSVFLETENGWQWIAHANLNPMK